MVICVIAMNATQVRREWSSICDKVAREKPVLIKRTRDNMILAEVSLLDEFLSLYEFNAKIITEDDGSITITLDEIDLVENGINEKEAVHKLALAILEYAEDYYADFLYWSRGNRKSHKPYVFKALILGNAVKIGGVIKCRHGEI